MWKNESTSILRNVITMSEIKSLSVGNGDMFYINHNSDNFSMIDCNIADDRKSEILDEVKNLAGDKGIVRFISTHPDQDHIQGIEYLDELGLIPNFYCVDNNVSKSTETKSFKKYKELKESPCAYKISKGCKRKWMNLSDNERGPAGISVLWPDVTNEAFQSALQDAESSDNPNNISPAIVYSLEEGVRALWLGDMENDYMVAIEDDIALSPVDILFAPHHGRKSGRVPKTWLDKLEPRLIVVGEAPSDELEYYSNYNTLTQNSAGDILFCCETGKTHVYVGSPSYSVNFLGEDPNVPRAKGVLHYLGSFDCGDR